MPENKIIMTRKSSIEGKGVFANPKVDIAFKRCLGREESKDATIGLLNAIIPGKNIADVQFLNVEFPRETADQKTIYVDVICTDNNGNSFVVEMQRAGQPFFMQRMSYYAARVISTLAMSKSDIAYAVKPCYVIAFLDFDMSKTLSLSDSEDRCMRHYVTVDLEVGGDAIHPGSPEFFYFDLTKFKKSLEESDDDKDIWLTLLNESQEFTAIPQKLLEDKSYAAFFEGLRRANFTTEESLQYDKEMTDEMCWQAALDFQRQQGMQQGLQQGLQQGAHNRALESARAMKAEGDTIDKIVRCTGLSLEEVAAI